MYQVMTNWSAWPAGSIISGEDIKSFHGTQTRPSESEIKKLGLTDTKGTPDERIAELIERGVLRDLDAAPKVLRIERPTFEDRAAANTAFTPGVEGAAANQRGRDLMEHDRRIRTQNQESKA
jgi:hypothetical protein